jgi:peroxiredoxin
MKSYVLFTILFLVGITQAQFQIQFPEGFETDKLALTYSDPQTGEQLRARFDSHESGLTVYAEEAIYFKLKATGLSVSGVGIPGDKLVLAEANGVYSIQGSSENELLAAYESFRKESLARLVYTVRSEIKQAKAAGEEQALDSLAVLEQTNYAKHRVELSGFLFDTGDSSIVLWVTSTRWQGDDDFALITTLTERAEARNSEAAFAKALRSKLNRFAALQVGQIAPGFELKSVTGETVNFHAIESEVTLVEFWASWCGPCRRESPGLNALYAKHKEEGLEIVGVSIDTKPDKWRSAVEADGFKFVQLNAPEGYQSDVAQDFNVTAIPNNLVLDADGRILAKNLYGSSLSSFISELLAD